MGRSADPYSLNTKVSGSGRADFNFFQVKMSVHTKTSQQQKNWTEPFHFFLDGKWQQWASQPTSADDWDRQSDSAELQLFKPQFCPALLTEDSDSTVAHKCYLFAQATSYSCKSLLYADQTKMKPDNSCIVWSQPHSLWSVQTLPHFLSRTLAISHLSTL